MATRLAEGRTSTAQELATTLDPEWVRALITRDTRNWGLWLLVSGLVQLVATGILNPAWGIVQIVVAAASFYFRSAAMLPVYGVTMAWAMISNILSGDPRWSALGLLQAYWAFTAFRKFLTVRRATSRLGIGLGADGSVQSDLPGRVFPWAGCALSAAALLGLVTLILVISITYALTEQMPNEQAIELSVAALMDSAWLGLALGIAATLSRFRWRLISLLAVFGGGLTIGVFILLAFLGS